MVLFFSASLIAIWSVRIYNIPVGLAEKLFYLAVILTMLIVEPLAVMKFKQDN